MSIYGYIERLKNQRCEATQIVESYGVKSSDDIYPGEPVYDDLYDYFVEQGAMPYGIMKARTGDPCEWIILKLEEMGVLKEDR